MTHPNTESKDDVAKTLGVGKSSVRNHRLRRWLLWGAPVIVALIVWMFLGGKGTDNGVQYVTRSRCGAVNWWSP